MKTKLYTTVLLLLSFLLSSLAFSQKQTNSSYFPLAIGNQWIYEGTNYAFSDTITVVDTQSVNGKQYFAVKENSSDKYTWYRLGDNKVYIIDTVAQRLDPSNIDEHLIYDFSADTGNNWNVPLTSNNIQCEYAGTVTLESKSDSIETSNNKFGNCYQFSRVVPCADAGRINEWFAAGTGRVAYYDESIAGIRKFSLKYTNVVTSVDNNSHQIISGYKLWQNFPNPFNPTTTINYSIPKESFVTIKVFDSLGRLVKTIVNETKRAGNYSVAFDADKLASGIYYYQLKAENYIETRKMTLINLSKEFIIL